MVRNIIDEFSNNILGLTITSLYNKLSILQSGKFGLFRNSPRSNVVILQPPPIVERNSSHQVKRKYKQDAQRHLERFIAQIEKNISPENLTLMYNNLKGFKMIEGNIRLIIMSIIPCLLANSYIGGGYDGHRNKIITYSEKGLQFTKRFFQSSHPITLESLYNHELLHMSSCNRTLGKICCGFQHTYAPFHSFVISNIGMGLNEGYTELLAERIFSNESAGGIYEFYKEVTRLLEQIIGQEKMTNLYFKNDLRGLIQQLEIYIPKKETKKFILNLDYLIRDFGRQKYIFNYLINLISNKIKQDLNENKITPEEAKIQYEQFKETMIKLAQILNKKAEKEKNSLITYVENFKETDLENLFGESTPTRRK